MNRSPMPPRKKPMPPPTSGLRRTTPMQRSSALAQPEARKAAPKRKRVDVGPTGGVVEAVVDRERLSCVRCGYGIGPNERGRRWSIHHRLRRSQGPDHSVQNLLLLCGGSDAPGCHGWVHANPDESRKHGWLLRGRMEPLAIPVYIPLEDRWVYLGADGLYRDVKVAERYGEVS